MKKCQIGEVISKHELETIRSEQVQIPHPEHLIHLQFRRFASCPICNRHLHSIVERHDEIVANGIREVVVFYSSVEEMLPYQGDLPFAAIADPEQTLYPEFGVESSTEAAPRGLPADFLIAPDGHVLACKYGVNPHDQWSVDELLSLARKQVNPAQ
ncbi:MAG TPA: redoxin domain-containing protein [Ktedonobacteraceae bacterium]|nr:redoxin domain-containing protein [Ktedonobacteraceae bacterium]